MFSFAIDFHTISVPFSDCRDLVLKGKLAAIEIHTTRKKCWRKASVKSKLSPLCLVTSGRPPIIHMNTITDWTTEAM